MIDDNTIIRVHTYVEPSNTLFYKFQVSLNGTLVNVTVGYNSRNEKRYVSIETQDTTVLLGRTFLDVGRKCYLNINSELLLIGEYFVTLEKIDDNKDDDFLNWQSNYYIVFSGIDYETKLEYDKFSQNLIYFRDVER